MTKKEEKLLEKSDSIYKDDLVDLTKEDPEMFSKKPTKDSVKKAEDKKVVNKKPVSPKKDDSKKVATKKPTIEKMIKKPIKEDDPTKVYHINKRTSDKKWTIKFANGQKVIKLFDTKEEALAYAEELADKQNGTVLVHASKGKKKGKIQKQ